MEVIFRRAYLFRDFENYRLRVNNFKYFIILIS